MKSGSENDPRTLEQILADEAAPSRSPEQPVVKTAPARKPISLRTWVWGGLAAFLLLAVMFGGPSDEQMAKIDAERQLAAQAESQRRSQAAAEALKAREARVEESIAKGQVFIGMTRDEVIVSWGRPEGSNVTQTAYGKHEQLVYGDQYLYLTDDRLTTIQTMR